MKNGLKHYLMVMLKGISMGAADVVPGVSGGTIAFITGIYDELIDTVKSINFRSLKLLFTGKFKAFWKAVNGNFLLSLFLGIGISVFSLAKLITWLLDEYPVMVWAFFFGLIVASAYFVAKDIREWNWKTVLSLLVGIGAAFLITLASPAQTPDALWFVFLCGAVAICAMILPGISGSFILLLLGKYAYIMAAVKDFNLPVIIIFLLGAVIGITSFSHLLSYALRKFRSVTLAVLTGFMAGSLNKVWPWKDLDANNLPVNIAPDAYLWQAILLALLGFAIVFCIETLSKRKNRF